ncbi:MAG: glycogen/starch synthase [Candidatus Margulisiibacteriota bacterium]
MPGSDLTVYFFDNEHFSNRDELYGNSGKDYPDNFEAFLTFSKAAIPFLKKMNWRPDVIHCNDWQSGPMVLSVHELRKTDPFFQRTAIVYSTHNMAYQGSFPDREIANFAEAGFINADVINSVSETYSKEIQTKENGYGLEEFVKERSQDVYGIVNGIDYEIWNPATDQNLVKRYSKMTLSLRSENKSALQKEMGLQIDESIPLIGIVSRLDVQKGFDILAEAMDDIMQLNCQFCLLGTGDPRYHELFNDLKSKHPDKIGLKLGFDAALAERIYAGSDMFLMPSKYEPCGLGQLISFKYGAIPIVRKTGGLADTVHDAKDGFVFEEYSSAALLEAIKRAIEAYKDKANWKKMQERVMEYDYSWDASAKKYVALYAKALDKVIK